MADLLQARFTKHLRAQAKAAAAPKVDPLACPYCDGRVIQDDEQLWNHVNQDHPSELQGKGLNSERGTSLFRKFLEDAIRKAKADSRIRDASNVSSGATAGGGSTPDLTRLSLDSRKGAKRDQTPSSYRTSKKRPAGSDINPWEPSTRFPIRQDNPRRAKGFGYNDPVDPYFEPDLGYSRDIPHTIALDSTRLKSSHTRLFDPNAGSTDVAPPFNHSGEERTLGPRQQGQQHPGSHRRQSKTHRQPSHGCPTTYVAAGPWPPSNPSGPSNPPQRQPGIIEIQRFDSRYPGLLPQPDSRPISQEQLAAEVKSIYAGLTMVETKIIHVDRAQDTAVHETDTEPNSKLANDHWQALIALQRTLLHEHHDFFLASQHPSASPALHRLASKYSMPARMWKNGIHSFLELLRRRILFTRHSPESFEDALSGPHTIEGLRWTRDKRGKTPEWEVAGRVGSIKVSALADSGSDLEVLSESFCSKHNLKIDKSKLRTIRLPKRGLVQSIGTVTLPFSFEGENGVYNCVFHVLKNCIHDVILGNRFLKATKTLTEFLVKRVKKVYKVLAGSRLRLLGSPKQRVLGSLNGRTVNAFPDTGSNVLIIDKAFAESLSLRIQTGSDYTTTLEFADGSLHDTCGVVLDVDWRFGNSTDSLSSFRCDFHVLDGLSCDVVLSNELLYGTNAFQRYEQWFFEVSDSTSSMDEYEFYELSVIKEKIFVKADAASASRTNWQNAKDEEDFRQANAEIYIASLPVAEQAAARVTEARVQEQWKRDNPRPQSPLLSAVQPPVPASPPNGWKEKLSLKGKTMMAFRRTNGAQQQTANSNATPLSNTNGQPSAPRSTNPPPTGP